MAYDTDGPAPLDELLEAAEPNPLLARVDGLCSARAWEDLVVLARRCREAYERGKQLWPIAEHIDYRLALEAPPRYAAAVLTPTAGRFALGPLTEVAASTHTFGELAPHLPSPQVAGVVAAERVLRGEDLTRHPDAHPEVLELPMQLQAWEPAYPLATYRAYEIEVPAPPLQPISHEGRGIPGAPMDEPEVTRALLDLVATWVSGSSGRADAVMVEGPASGAISALQPPGFLIGAIAPRQAMALMGWAGASGGAHGRRRGGAAGRSGAWWASAALCDLDWPVEGAELAAAMEGLRWYRWEPMDVTGGWTLHLAVEDPGAGWAAAIAAEDRAD